MGRRRPDGPARLARLRAAEADYCRNHPVYFVENYCHIEDKDAPQLIAPFRLWPGQKKALQAFATHRLCVVLKARQLGFTWLALAEAARLLVLWPGRTVVGLSRSEEEAKELVRRLGVMLEHMPEFAQPAAAAPPGWQGAVFEVTALRISLRFPGGPPGVFQAFPSGPSVGRSFTADLILIDEWAFQQFAHEIWASAFPVVNRPGGGRVIGLSTIRRGTLFEEIFTGKNNGFHKLFLPWSADPRRDEGWYRRTLAALGRDRTLQEYPASVAEALTVPGGAFFPEVARHTHTAAGLPQGSLRRYVAIDYGLDMLSAHWIAVDEQGRAVVYREYDAPDLTIGGAAAAVLERCRGEDIELVLAPPDLWNRSQESGRSRAQLFSEAGLVLTRSSRDFSAGCAAMKEWLAPGRPGGPAMTLGDVPRLWDCLERVQTDEHDPNVYAKTPHHLTHDLDSLRYFCVWWKQPAKQAQSGPRAVWEADLYEDYENADEEGKAYLLRRYGDPWR